eukprot:Mycagemm_TRINITY_DN10691_c0_g1::TRINITY_DN10691_c0_g1_i1::g.4969::m.4969 type:complete len:356 gc:universal TRINITY_DN10691_c0_g1_i1:1080-13(-)
MLKFKGISQFRQRLVFATLSGKTVVITDIRPDDTSPGLKDFEANFLRLLEKLTNGCKIVINVTGTSVSYKPGSITGGLITHDCGKTRGIGYFLEGIIPMAPFSKAPFALTLTGITSTEEDISVDVLRTVCIPLLQKVGLADDLQLKVNRRGAHPEGGGQVFFKCPVTRHLSPLTMVDEGKVARVRGVCYVTRMSPATANRVVDGARSVLQDWSEDVFIYVEHPKGAEGGLSSGFGLSLVAESSTGCFLSAEGIGSAGQLPEELGQRVARLLLAEVAQGGCIDTAMQSIPLTLMALNTEDLSKLRVGKLSPYSIECLRLLREFFGITFKVDADAESRTVLLSCLGIGFQNLSKKST